MHSNYFISPKRNVYDQLELRERFLDNESEYSEDHLLKNYWIMIEKVNEKLQWVIKHCTGKEDVKLAIKEWLITNIEVLHSNYDFKIVDQKGNESILNNEEIKIYLFENNDFN